jgi:hypothetical protein
LHPSFVGTETCARLARFSLTSADYLPYALS